MFEGSPEKKRRESYESLYGLRFPNASVAELDDAESRFLDDDSGTSRSDNENLNLSLYIDQEEITPAECCTWIRRRFFTKRKLYRLCPPISWLPRYSTYDLKGDIISGISVAFTIVPQGLALASLAGLPPQYGLYTSFMGCFIYAMLGSCKDMAVGPTSILAMIVLPYVMIGGPQYSILLSFFGGFVQLFAGFLNLGFIVDFVSFPVISAFSFAAAISISASQLKGFFGLQYSASRFPEIMSHFFGSLNNLNPWDVVLGCCSMAFLLPLQIYKDFRLDTDSICPYDQRGKLFFCKAFNFLWNLIIIGRNAIAVLIGSLVTIYYGTKLDVNGDVIGNCFTLTRKITPGLPSFQFPTFELLDSNNTVIKTFDEVSGDIGTGIFVVALLGLMESVAVANAFKSPNSQRWDATQEMIALGVTNILGSFVGAFPATGSFSRSAVNHNSGVRTPLGGVITGSLVLAALSTFSSYFEHIPETVLATIIITSVIFMAHPSDVLLVYKTNRIDLLPFTVTFACSLLIGLEVGMLIGIGVSVSILLYHMARPHIFTVTKVAPNGCPFLYVKPDRSIFFSSVEYMKIKINKNLKQLKQLTKSSIRSYHVKQNVVVVDGEHMFRTDSTFALGLKNMVANLRNRNVTVIFYRLRRQVFRAIVGVALYPTSFHNCRTEEEVYQLIRTLNETTRLKHSTSLCLSTMQREKDKSNSMLSTCHNELGSRFNWLTQSSKQF